VSKLNSFVGFIGDEQVQAEECYVGGGRNKWLSMTCT
jgi:hypothetical protein